MGDTLTRGDAVVVCAYLVGVLAIAWLAARRQRDGDDYFLAGRTMPGWALALSILANQTSTISLIGIPAFVAVTRGGGLRWLQYELALPLAMLAILVVLLEPLRQLSASSIYALVEKRFGLTARRVLAGAFILSRGLSLGVILYASALVAGMVLGWPVDRALVAVGLFAVLYTSLGGIVADIWSDVVQLVVLWGGVVAAMVYLLAGEGPGLWMTVPAARTQALVWTGSAGAASSTYTFWPMLIGGFFLYASYYGCDQTQAQRLLAARSTRDARTALLLNGLLRFPLVLTYCALGLLLAGLLQVDPAFARTMATLEPDHLVPAFMLSYLPPGLRGVLLAALLAAAMSSIDSALNSLSAVTLEDVLDRPSWSTDVWTARSVSLAWGVFAIGSGLVFARTGSGVLELVNQVGSVFYGPVLAVFVLAAMTCDVAGSGAIAGLAAGVTTNLLLAGLAPGLSWMWWNATGFAATAAVALGLSPRRLWLPVLHWPRAEAALLVAGFGAMLGVLALL